MKTLFAFLAALAVACGGDSGTQPEPPAAEERPGQAAVYERIESMTNCDKLQQEFDTADANHANASNDQQKEWTLAYMEAADARMQEVGCYDE